MAYTLSGGGHHGGGHHGGGHHGGGHHGGGYGGGWGGYYGGGIIYPNVSEKIIYVVPEETAEEKKIRLAKEKAALKAAGLSGGLGEFFDIPPMWLLAVGGAAAIWWLFLRKKKSTPVRRRRRRRFGRRRVRSIRQLRSRYGLPGRDNNT